MRWPFSRRAAGPGRAAPGSAPRIAPVRAAAPPVLSPGEAFTPTQPRSGAKRVVGREPELDRILEALLDERAHVVLYSERGRGKTSLSNLVVQTLRRGGVMVARHTCEAASTFDTVMRGLLRDMPRSLLAIPANGANEVGCEAALPDGPVHPHAVAGVMARLTCRRLVCLVDEFDRIEDPVTRTRLADTVKQLSDHAVPLLFLIVGVSENLEQILGQHPSIQRNLVAVQLPLLGREEIAAIVETGARQTGLSVDARIASRVAELSRGSPYMAQLVGLRLVQATLRRGGRTISDEDLEVAIIRLLESAPPAQAALFDGLTRGGSDPALVHALSILAAAEQDANGRFLAWPLGQDGSVAVGAARLPEHVWAHLLEHGVVRPAGALHGQHVFADLGFMFHILMRQMHEAARARRGAPALHVVGAET